MSAQSTFWGRQMTVKFHDGNGSETVVRLSMQSVIALSTVFIVAIVSGLTFGMGSCRPSSEPPEMVAP